MKEKTIKFSKAVVKGGCWILKCFIPGWRFQGVFQDIFDECAEYIVDNMPDRNIESEIMGDEFLGNLEVPESQYELVRHSIKSMLKDVRLDENTFKESEYETSQVVEYLWNGYSEKDEYSWEEQRNIKKVLYQIVKETFEILMKNVDFLPILLSKVQKLSNNMDIQKEETRELREKICELEKSIIAASAISTVELVGKEMKYQKNWEIPLFLNRRDPKLCLKDIYQVPEYYLKLDHKNSYDNMDGILDELMKEKVTSDMLLVLGKPGSGKSSLITYILNRYTDKCMKKILVFPFSTLKDIEWDVNNTQISKEILHAIGVSDIKQLNNYVFILDGFDEISINGNRENIINQLYEDWVENVNDIDVSIIITCRENYLQRLGSLQCKFITLCLLTKEQIGNFCRIYWEKAQINKYAEEYIEKLCTLRDIVGIPLIIYMTVALEINIVGTTDICDVYDKIFSLNGGIYDRCEYSAMGHPLTSPLKQQIHDVTKKISIKMWTDNPEEAFILQRDYEKIIAKEDQKNVGLKNIVLIGQYFQYVKYCEGLKTEEIRFVHRSIYEYFVALTIYDVIREYLELPNEKFSIEELKNKLLILLQKRQLSVDIEGYLSHKIKEAMYKTSNTYRKACYGWWKEFFSSLLSHGMSIEEPILQSNLEKIENELVAFINMVALMRIIGDCTGDKSPYCIYDEGTILQKISGDSPKECMEKYIRYISEAYQNNSVKRIDHLDLSKLVIEKFQLNGINLSNVDLSNTDLRNSNLNGTNLRKYNLNNAILQECDLRTANLSSANLENAKMQNVKLMSANLSKAKFFNTYMSRNGLAAAVYKELAEKEIIWM